MDSNTYACFELRVELKDAVTQVKIPFETEEEAIEYIYSHADGQFHTKIWLE